MDYICSKYNSKEGASGALADYTDITTVAAFASLFSGVGIALKLIIRTDSDIEVKLNSTSNDSITIATATDSPFELNWLAVSKVFVKCAGGANLKIIVGR